jgi:hypothetical protein
MKNFFLGGLVILLLATSVACNKDQRAVRRLSGEWKVVSAAGFAISENSDDFHTLKFSNCRLRSEEFCDVTISDNEGSETIRYKVTDDGSTLVYKDNDNEKQSLEIVTLERSKLQLRMQIPLIGGVLFEYEKK